LRMWVLGLRGAPRLALGRRGCPETAGKAFSCKPRCLGLRVGMGTPCLASCRGRQEGKKQLLDRRGGHRTPWREFAGVLNDFERIL
jgi:hypothetical protein